MALRISKSNLWLLNNLIAAFLLKCPLIFYTYLYLFFLDQNTHGFLQTISAYAAIFFPIITLSIYTGYGRKIYDQHSYNVKYVTQWFYKVLLYFTAITVIVTILTKSFFPIYFVVVILIISWLLDILNLQYSIRIKKVHLFNIKIFLKYVFITIVFLTLNFFLIQDFLISLLISEILGIFFNYLLHQEAYPKKIAEINIKLFIKESLFFSLPLVVYNCCSVIISQVDRIMIGSFLGYEQVSIFTLAYNTAGISLIVINGVFNTMLPNYFKQKKRKISDHHFSLKLISFSFVATISLIYICLYSFVYLSESKFNVNYLKFFHILNIRIKI